MSLDDDPPDVLLDRALAGGRPAGPELDRVWARVTGTRRAERRRVWLSRIAIGGVPAAVVATALVFWVRPAELASRGATVDAPVLEASCGSSGNACAVGAPMYLRLHGSDVAGTVVVELAGEVVFGPTLIDPRVTLVVPTAVIPENSDAGRGIALRLLFLPFHPSAGGQQPRARSIEEVRRAGTARELRVDVLEGVP